MTFGLANTRPGHASNPRSAATGAREAPLLTIFGCPKPFTDRHIATIQRNAITSWTRLTPRPEVVLMGDEDGTAELCRELGLRHVPDITRNEYRTPQLSDLFAKAHALATGRLLCYANADMIFTDDFMTAVRYVSSRRPSFVLASCRRDTELTELIDFDDPGWSHRLRARAPALRSRYAELHGADYFVFTRNVYCAVPPFVPRFWWDGWLLWKGRREAGCLVDATAAILAIHQRHDHANVLTRCEAPWFGPEARRNMELAGTTRQWHLLEATHVLGVDGLRRIWGQKALYVACTTIRGLFVYRLGGLRRALGLRWQNLARLRVWLRQR